MPTIRKMPEAYDEVSPRHLHRDIDKRGPDECWEWTGDKRNGYGIIRYPGGAVLAHRYMHWLKRKENPPVVMHTCDNPGCVNPKHLRGGTQSENMREMVWKGRHSPQRGNTHHNAKLNGQDVRMIRIMHKRGHKVRFLAEYNGVSEDCIRSVLSYRTWRHIP